MRFKTLSLIGAAALLAAPLTTARAQYNIQNPANNVCGGTGFFFTFCVNISAVQTGANFFITIMNNGLNGSGAAPYNNLSLTAIGFNGFAAAPIIFAQSVGASFVQDNNINDLSNFGGTWRGGSSTPPPVANGLLFNEFITFEFLNTTAANFGPSAIAFHAQAGPGNCSSKMMFNLSGGQLPPNGPAFIDPSCGGPPTTVPEPASIVLMATGLFGVFGFARFRRQS